MFVEDEYEIFSILK